MTDLRELPQLRDLSETPSRYSGHEFRKMQIAWYNESAGTLGYLDCPECRNKGYIAYLGEQDEEIRRECVCLRTRRNLHRMAQSGLGELLERCTFDAFETPEPWQVHAKSRVMAYTEQEGSGWLYVAGQSGCGKTHLCTAVCRTFLLEGKAVKYVLWRELYHELQGLQYRIDEYRSRMQALQNAEILYIDDFLKMPDKNTQGKEIAIAFEVINARYNRGLRTIISSELFLTDVSGLDAATGGRIAERARGFVVQMQRDDGRNYRLR